MWRESPGEPRGRGVVDDGLVPVCVRTVFRLDAGTGYSLCDTARAEAVGGRL